MSKPSWAGGLTACTTTQNCSGTSPTTTVHIPNKLVCSKWDTNLNDLLKIPSIPPLLELKQEFKIDSSTFFFPPGEVKHNFRDWKSAYKTTWLKGYSFPIQSIPWLTFFNISRYIAHYLNMRNWFILKTNKTNKQTQFFFLKAQFPLELLLKISSLLQKNHLYVKIQDIQNEIIEKKK